MRLLCVSCVIPLIGNIYGLIYGTSTILHKKSRALIFVDFKWNFSPDKSPQQIDALHERVANRMHYVCTENGG